ncbi:MAG TPA: SRPBCC family protein [Solirubrobacterales bacterium]|nr:SRPBCC family protein [Solirubrobacterales bacterium]
MIDFTIETEIERPVAEVFAYVTDPDKLADWQTNTVSAEIEGGSPLGLGTRLREVHRGPGGKELASLVEVSEYEPERRFSLDVIEGALPVDARIGFEPTAAGTRIAFNVKGQPRGPMRFLAPLLKVALKRQFSEHLANLKRVLEDGGA